MSDASKYRRNPRLADEIINDHRTVEVLMHQLTKAMDEGDKMHMTIVGDTVATIIRLHSQAEMDVLYPALADALGDQGSKLQSEALQEHAEVEKLVGQAMQANKGSKQMGQALVKACELFLEHAEDEEVRLLPLLVQNTNETTMLGLEKRMTESKMNAPLTPQVP